ncbi:MAG: carboxypeptidase M32 [candidate division Zixibacteria bacterium]
MNAQEVYNELIREIKEISLLGSCYGVLEWDHRVNMPPMGAEIRAQMTSLLAGMMHEKFVSPQVGEMISAVEESDLVKDPLSVEAVNIRELRYMYDKEIKLPKDLVEEIEKTTALAHNEWAAARKASDFKIFEPWLKKIVDLTKKKAEAYGYEGEPYNALLDNYEPGATVDEVADVFEKLRVELVELLVKIKDAPEKPKVSIVEQPYDIARQKIFGEMVADRIGYDFNQGRLDVATHPFSAGFGPGDSRITTRYNPNHINEALFGTIHETGHALYMMGIDQKTHFGTPMGKSISLGIHESQSRMWENMVGRSKSFWKYFFPIAKSIFREPLNGVTLDDFYGAVNNVAPSFIRVEADEVTYNLHILLRFEMERALLNGDVKIADAAKEWNERFEKYFGIKVDKDANGCLQDIHWSSGYIGYFPTYALGNIYAAQFFAQAKKDISDLEQRFEQGDFLTLREWLRENIHIHGQKYRAQDLCRNLTGEGLSHIPLVKYLNEKFGEIYGL